MKLSVKSRYGIKVMIVLAENYGKGIMTLGNIAAEASVTEPYLEKLLSLLRKADLVSSTRGATGGYELTRSPNEISAGEIVRALEDGLEIVECINGGCGEKNNCSAYAVWNKLYHAINDTLDGISLNSLIKEERV